MDKDKSNIKICSTLLKTEQKGKQKDGINIKICPKVLKNEQKVSTFTKVNSKTSLHTDWGYPFLDKHGMGSVTASSSVFLFRKPATMSGLGTFMSAILSIVSTLVGMPPPLFTIRAKPSGSLVKHLTTDSSPSLLIR